MYVHPEECHQGYQMAYMQGWRGRVYSYIGPNSLVCDQFIQIISIPDQAQIRW